MIKVPDYRFKNYADHWEQRKFKEYTKLSQGLQIAIADRFLEDGENRYFYITNEFLNPNSDKKYYIESPSKNVICSKRDILMTRTGNTGKVVTDIEGAFHNNFFKVAYDSKESSKLFLFHLLNSPKIQKELLVRAGNSTIPDLNHNDFYSIKTIIPSLPEQTAIGSFFQGIDQLISLQQRKLEVLKEQKKTYLKLLFPAKGQTKPALRFAGFEDEWKEVKLGEVCSIKGGNAWKSEHYSTDGKYLVVTISNVKGNEYIDDTYGNRIDTVESQFILEQGDILISLTGNVGRVSKMTEVSAVLNQRVGKLATNQSNNFLFTLLSNRNFEKEMVLSSQGAAQANISNNDVLNYKTSFPSLPEQEVIGSFFQDLDKAIAKQEEKVNQLKENKQTLLRKMFI